MEENFYLNILGASQIKVRYHFLEMSLQKGIKMFRMKLKIPECIFKKLMSVLLYVLRLDFEEKK